MSETICDLANANAYKHHVPGHRLEPLCEPEDQWNQSPAVSEPGGQPPEPEAPAATRGPPPQAPVPVPSGRGPRPASAPRADGATIPVPSGRPQRGRFRPTLPPIAEEEAGPELPGLLTGDPSGPSPTGLPTPLPAPPPQRSNRPLREVDVFVDDFIGLAQGSRRQLRNLRRTILHAVDEVLDRPPAR